MYYMYVVEAIELLLRGNGVVDGALSLSDLVLNVVVPLVRLTHLTFFTHILTLPGFLK